jgi:hypothetical protein
VGKDEHGGYHLLDMRRDVLDVAHYKEEDSEELYSLREIDDELGHLNYSIPLLVLRYVPKKLLETPLPQASSNLDPEKGERLTRPMPDFLRFLWERSSIYPVIPQDYYMISATAIDHAICEAISTSNHYFLDAIFALPLSADGETKLQPVTAGHFIAAAQLLDAKAIELLWQKGYSHFEKEWLFLYNGAPMNMNLFSSEDTGIFPFENNEVIAWMKHAARKAQQSPCGNLAFIHYIMYFRNSLAAAQPAVPVATWRHEARLQGHSGSKGKYSTDYYLPQRSC